MKRVYIAKNNTFFFSLKKEDEKVAKCAIAKCEKSAVYACIRLITTLAKLCLLMIPKKIYNKAACKSK
jgi:hypothetical protein